MKTKESKVRKTTQSTEEVLEQQDDTVLGAGEFNEVMNSLPDSKKYENLTIMNNFIFSKVMREPELCKELLQRILDIEIERLEYVEYEKTIDVELETRGIRLDIYVKDDEASVYNVEMQVRNETYLPKRIRYYQSLLDMKSFRERE